MSDQKPVFFPPEWAHQSAILLAWPYPEGDFSPWLADVEQTYRQIARAVTQRQKLIVVCKSNEQQRHIEALLSSTRITSIEFIILPYNDVWVRDTAPITVQTPTGPQFLDFRFNAWGGKYEHADDAALAARLHAGGVLGNAPLKSIDLVLEGGSLETDGSGTLMTTTRCLLNPNRNPELNQAEIEQQLKDHLGLSRILWLEHGYAEGDDTDAHIDTLARFCPNDTIAYTACDRPDDPLYGELKAMEYALQEFRTCDNRPYRLIALPIPERINSEEGWRLPATYANFLVINAAVLAPTYDDPADNIALQRLAVCFPDREIIAVASTALIRQYGSIHCMTMQFPDFSFNHSL